MLLVLLDHAGVAAFDGGFVGVDVFFVLSGFLITGLLLKEIEQTGRISFAQFYARRARRLLPASTLVLLATVIASYAILGPAGGNRAAEDGRWAALFASNFRFIEQGANYLDAQLPPSPLQHYWSLAVEEQFYFAWPAVMLAVSLAGKRFALRKRLAVALTAIILGSLVWSVRQTTTDGTTAYFSPLTRAYELGLGSMLAVIAPGLSRAPRRIANPLGLVGIGLILFAAGWFSPTTAFPGWTAQVPVIGTVLVVAAGGIQEQSVVERGLAIMPLQWLGQRSYSLYLWHWPLLVLGAAYAGRDLTSVEGLMLCAAAVPLSALTFSLLEDPVRNAGWLKARPAIASVGLGCMMVIASIGATSWLMQLHQISEGSGRAVAMVDGELPELDDVLQAVADGAKVTTWPQQPERIANPAYSEACDVTRQDTTSSACVHGDPSAARTMVVYGDSHAAQWIPAFDLIGQQQSWQVVQLTKPGCQAADFPRYSETFKREYTECSEFRAFALGEIERLQPDLVVIASASKDATVAVDGAKNSDGLEAAWESGLRSVLAQIAPMTDRIVVLGMMPYPAEPGIDCLTDHPNDVQACNTPREVAVHAEHNAMEARVAGEMGARYVDVTPWFCTETVCPAVIAGLTTHRDAFHIAENYAVWLADPLARAVGMLADHAVLTQSR